MVMDRGGEASLLTPPQRSERRYGVLGPQSTMRDRDGVGFASHENLAEVVPYLNRSLNDLGYPSPLELEAPSAGDLARVANVLFLVLRDRTQDISSREQWGRERRRLTADKTRAETFYERARAELAAKDEELANSLAKSDGRVDKERKRLDETTAEVTALKQRLLKSTQRCATLENESRRREKEREKLSARLEKFVNDRRRDVANAAPVGVMRLGRPDDTREPGHVVEEKVAYGGLNAANVSAHVSVHATGRHKDLTAATATSKAAALDAAARVAAAAASPFVSQELHHQMMGAYEAKMRSLMHDANDLRELLTANGVDPETGERIGGLGAGSDFVDQGVVRMEEPEPRSHAMALGDVEDETAAAARDAARAAAATEAEIGVGDDAFSFNLGALRDRLGSPSRKPTRVEATERLPTAPPAALGAPGGNVSVTGRTRGEDHGDVMDVDEGNEGAFGSPSPIEVALAWHEREHARLKSVLTHPPKALREASTPEVQFEVEKTILSPVKSVASVGGSLAAAREGLHAAVAAAARASPARRSSPGGAHRSQKPQTTASASASPARQQLHWNEPPFTAVSAPIYESSPSVSSAGDGPEEPPPPTPRMAPPPMFDNPMLSIDDALDDEELAREAAAAAAEREAEAAAAAFAAEIDASMDAGGVQSVPASPARQSPVKHSPRSPRRTDGSNEDLLDVDVGLADIGDDDMYVADEEVEYVEAVVVRPRSDTISAFVAAAAAAPSRGGFGSPADAAAAFGGGAGGAAGTGRFAGRFDTDVENTPALNATAAKTADFGASLRALSPARAAYGQSVSAVPAGPAAEPAPASPLDELLARHLNRGRSRVGEAGAAGGDGAEAGGEKEDWRSRYRRRRANPFASFAANDAKLAVDATQQTPGFAMLHSG